VLRANHRAVRLLRDQAGWFGLEGIGYKMMPTNPERRDEHDHSQGRTAPAS